MRFGKVQSNRRRIRTSSLPARRFRFTPRAILALMLLLSTLWYNQEMRYCTALLALIVVTSSSALSMAAEDLNVLPKGADALLYSYLLRQSRKHYERRATDVRAALQSPDAVARRQKRLLGDYRRIIGELPRQKTPLNAKITGIIQCDGYRIENVLFASRPNHHVTANLYVPTGAKGPFPGVAMPCGHSANGKAAAAYQSACVALVLNGFVVLIYDPICQGERHQLLKAPRHGTTTHSMLNPGSLLVGRTIVGYEAWDGIRAIDYLLSRDEVNRDKPIGLTGNSGGGTQTNFLMALDDRVGPAAPSCYVMTKQRKYETLDPADGCQHLPSEVALGIDHVDYLWMRAPRPTLILAAEQDFFEFRATQAAAAEATELYTTLGLPKRTGLFSFDDKHGFSQPRRQAAVAWMRRWLLDDASPIVQPELKLQTDRALQVTKTGQVVTSHGQQDTVDQMNLRRAKDLADIRTRFWNGGDPQSRLTEIRRLLGLSEQRAAPNVKHVGSINREGYRIEKLIIQRNAEIVLPALLFLPTGVAQKRHATIYVDGRGKSHDSASGETIEKLVRGGRIVLSVDLRGFGETADRGSNKKFFNVEHRVANLAMHLGQPLLGQRVDDIFTAADVMAARDDVVQLDLVGIGRAGPVALHAAALDERFKSVSVRDSIASWSDDVVSKPLDRDLLGHVVPGALLKYDLPDLIKITAPRK